ncbi:restriction endonuclease type II-like protein [Vibrio phage 1.052.A._10N.286.46.C3]|nr:restriction endonuclease type II-like protein [Vibrio phage 1.052.A._10N.286.46.C3]
MIKIIEVEQGSIEWHNERFGSVTGTRFQSAIGAKMNRGNWVLNDKKVQDTLMAQLISERMSQNEIDDYKNKDMQRGHDLEPLAVSETGKYHGIEFQTCGMLYNPDIEFFKYSPDAVYFRDGLIVGGAETKCPSGKKHVQYMIEDVVPQEYFWQVAAPFVLDDQIEFWDFSSFDDRNYERELFTIRVVRADVIEWVEPARLALREFLDRVNDVHLGLTF